MWTFATKDQMKRVKGVFFQWDTWPNSNPLANWCLHGAWLIPREVTWFAQIFRASSLSTSLASFSWYVLFPAVLPGPLIPDVPWQTVSPSWISEFAETFSPPLVPSIEKQNRPLHEIQKALGHSLSLRGYFSLLDFIMKVLLKFSVIWLTAAACTLWLQWPSISWWLINDLLWFLHKSAPTDYWIMC